MKLNDVVRKVVVHPKGETLAHNFPSPEAVVNFMSFEFKHPVKVKVEPDPLNAGAFSPILEEDWNEVYEGKVNWVVEGVASITSDARTFISEDAVGEGWVVIQEAPMPTQTAQEKASSMTVEELRASLENLRSLRARPVKVKSNVGKEVSPSDPLALALAKLSPEQVAKIKAKLGLQ